MIFNTFGDINKPPIVIMHGMCQDWTPILQVRPAVPE